MNNNRAAIAIAATEARSAIDPSATLADRFRAAFKAVHRHWLLTDEDGQLMAGCEAVYAAASQEEKDRIERELRLLKNLEALISGVPVDIERMAEGAEEHERIGIIDLWRETVGA